MKKKVSGKLLNFAKRKLELYGRGYEHENVEI